MMAEKLSSTTSLLDGFFWGETVNIGNIPAPLRMTGDISRVSSEKKGIFKERRTVVLCYKAESELHFITPTGTGINLNLGDELVMGTGYWWINRCPSYPLLPPEE